MRVHDNPSICGKGNKGNRDVPREETGGRDRARAGKVRKKRERDLAANFFVIGAINDTKGRSASFLWGNRCGKAG